MSVKLIGRIINSECYTLISYPDDGSYRSPYYQVRKVLKPLFYGDHPPAVIMGSYNDEATARADFKLICEAAQEYGRE